MSPWPLLVICAGLLSAQGPAAAPALQHQAASALPEALTAHLKDISVLHVDFTQTRHIAALSRPLKASGSMVLSREHGILWQIRKPMVLGFVITQAGLKEIGPDGMPKKKAAQDSAVVAQVGRILQSLLQGKWSALDNYFSIRAEGRPEQWKIILVPKAQTAAFMKGIQVSGGRFIERVQLDEPGGDHMELLFEHARTLDPLTEAESRLFSQD